MERDPEWFCWTSSHDFGVVRLFFSSHDFSVFGIFLKAVERTLSDFRWTSSHDFSMQALVATCRPPVFFADPVPAMYGPCRPGMVLAGPVLATIPPTLLLLCEDGSSNENCSDVERNGLELLEYKQLDIEDKGDDCASDSSQFEIASSPQGNVKISLICNSSRKSGFRIPSLDAVLKLVEEKFIKTYRITEPGFSVVKLMKDVCECFLAEGTNCTDDRQVRSTNLTSSLAISKKLSAQDVVCGRGYEGNFCIPPSFPNEPFRFRNFIEVLPQIPRDLTSTSSNVLNYITELNVNGNSYCGRDIKIKALEGLGPSNPSSLVVVQKHNSCLDPLKASHHIDDITRGAENAKISLVNEITDECLPEFHYIPRNIAYEHACVKFLLARVSDENCCSNCVGDCMSLIVPCACAGETGGEFTYTHGRLVEEKFLEKCISLNCDPEQHRLFYCKDCPLERSKHKRVSGPCKGHLVRLLTYNIHIIYPPLPCIAVTLHL
ncbi:hypothetical protein HYC85_019588 [Camellia sinensis]|uniref:Pre-SET domain-containing protein n=1 Tax=Camellia sinensis TaxID=4442 RepID=A0A7J7GR14_CAMSI|nr:hypothetical protein HYC85_019588 [Camellia sinensis]